MIRPIPSFGTIYPAAHPFFSSLSLQTRIAATALAIFALALPFAVYYGYSRCFPKNTTVKTGRSEASIFQNFFTSKPKKREVLPYSKAGDAAIQYALGQAQVLKTPTTSLRTFDEHQKANNELTHMRSLCSDAQEKFLEALKKKGCNDAEVTDCADHYMKLSFAVSCKTLESLESFTKQAKGKKECEDSYGDVSGETKPYIVSLIRQDAYLFRTYFYCTQTYHYLRGELRYGIDPEGVWRHDGDQQTFFTSRPGEISAEHARLFYQPGTVQSQWRELYNEFCDRVGMYVDLEQLAKGDSRFVRWINRDEEANSAEFRPIPDTLPT